MVLPAVTAANQVAYRRLDLRFASTDWIVSLVCEGDVLTADRGGWRRARTGEVMLHAPSPALVERAARPGVHQYFAFRLAPDVAPLSLGLPTSSVVAQLAARAFWAARFTELLRLLRQPPGAARELRVAAAAADLLSAVVEGLGPSEARPSDPRVALARSRLERNLTVPWTRASIAAEVHLHPAQLDRLFRREHGVSPMAHLRELRLQRARALLMAREAAVSEVAHMCGIGDPAYFSRAFRRRFGVAPSGTRRLSKDPRSPS